MTEQTIINPALWRAVATELDRIASADWTATSTLQQEVWHAVRDMPDCEQRDGILRAQGSNVLRSGAAAIRGHRWLLHALAGALRAEAAGAEQGAPVALGSCIWCGKAVVVESGMCGFCGHTQ